MIEKNGVKVKQFYGMSSATAMQKHAGGVAEYRYFVSWSHVTTVVMEIEISYAMFFEAFTYFETLSLV